MMNSKEKKNSETDEESVMEKSISKSDGDYRWSLNIFNQKKLEEEQERVDASITVEEKAGMSVLNNLADDVHISVKGNHISITILVSG